jgi:hypothetical protein
MSGERRRHGRRGWGCTGYSFPDKYVDDGGEPLKNYAKKSHSPGSLILLSAADHRTLRID